MDLRTFELPPIGTNAYLWITPENKAILFDAPLYAWETIRPVLEETGAELEALLLTHGHWDHVLGAAEIRAQGIPVHAHPGDRQMMEDSDLIRDYLPDGLAMEPITIDHWLGPGQLLNIAGLALEVRHVPGHSPGSVLFYGPTEAVAISGDALFAGGVGRYDLPGGDWPTLERSIRSQIYTLPPRTVIHPGHGPRTTVEREAASNPFVQQEA